MLSKSAIKSTEVRPHVEAARRQFLALGRLAPDIDVDALEAQARAAEEELQKPATKADIADLCKKLEAILWAIAQQRECPLKGHVLSVGQAGCELDAGWARLGRLAENIAAQERK